MCRFNHFDVFIGKFQDILFVSGRFSFLQSAGESEYAIRRSGSDPRSVQQGVTEEHNLI